MLRIIESTQLLKAIKEAQARPVEFVNQSSPIISSVGKKKYLRFKINAQLFRVAHQEANSIFQALLALRRLRVKYHKIFREQMYSKIAEIDGRYYWRLLAPGYPSEALREMQKSEINRVIHFDAKPRVRALILAITRRCPMNCEHCYEWPSLGKTEALTVYELIDVVRKYQQHGIGQIVFGGGEPMVRFKDMCQILQSTTRATDFWMYTSGFNLDLDKAHQLKSVGLTGVMVSLDHFLADSHDKFRGYPGAYQMAITAAIASKKAGLVTGLALCATNEFCQENNIRSYMDLARRLGVTFVQIIEPKAAGKYAESNVRLTTEKIEILEQLTCQYNKAKRFEDYPIINYPESVLRKIGCPGGERILYINSLGEVRQCPFCSQTCGSAVNMSAAEQIDGARNLPCPEYAKATI